MTKTEQALEDLTEVIDGWLPDGDAIQVDAISALATLREALTDTRAIEIGLKQEVEIDLLKSEVEINKMLIADLTHDTNEEFDGRKKAEAELEKVKAEVERLKKLICSGDNEQAGLFLHQAGVMAELATDRCRLIADNNCLKARAEKEGAYAEKLSRERNAAISALETAEAELVSVKEKFDKFSQGVQRFMYDLADKPRGTECNHER